MSRGGRPRTDPVRTRTCIGCRRRDQAHAFVRLRLVEGVLGTAPEGAGGGRGAYLCSSDECATKAVRALGKAFRRPGVHLTPAQLGALVKEGSVAAGPR